MGFQKQLTLGFTMISVGSMAVCIAASYLFVSRIVQNLTLDGLNKDLTSIQTTLEVTTKENSERIEALMNYWSKVSASSVEVRTDQNITQTVENKFTHEKLEAKIPKFIYQGKPLSDHEFVDQVSQKIDGVSTVFARFDQGFVRLSTSIRNEDGSRAVGTYLPLDAPQVKALLDGKRYVGRSKILGSTYFVAYEPIFANHKVVGAFFLGSRDGSEAFLKSYLKGQKLLKTGYFYILDTKGNFVLHPSKEGQNVLESLDLDGKPIFKQIIDAKDGVIHYRWLNQETKSPQNKVALFRFFKDQDWIVSASLNLAEVNASTIQLRWTLISIAMIMSLLTIAATLVFGKKVASRLGSVANALSSANSEVTHSSSELGNASNTLAQASTQQAASLQQTVSSIEEINSMMAKTLETTHHLEELSKQMTEEAKSGSNVLVDLQSAIAGISDKNKSVADEMKTSHEEINKIADVISSIESKTQVINDIVFQTRLLSFNASVEAARAGEHGKGFAVVAEEVGRLAQLSGGAASEIRENLEKSREQVRAIVAKAQERMTSLIQEAQRETGRGVEVSERCKQAFESLITRINTAHTSIEQITSANNEQSLGISEIGKATHQLDIVTHQNASTAQKVKSSADTLEQNSTTLSQAVDQLKAFLHGEVTAASAPVVQTTDEDQSSTPIKIAA